MGISMQVERSALGKSVEMLPMVIGRKGEYRHCKVGSCGEWHQWRFSYCYPVV